MKRKLIRLLAILLITVLIALGLCSCTMKEDSTEAREICEDYFDAVIDNDFAAAYDIFDEIATREQVEDMWSYTKDALGKSKSYELKQEGWNTETDDGVTLRQVSFELVSDDDKTMYVTIVLDDEGEPDCPGPGRGVLPRRDGLVRAHQRGGPPVRRGRGALHHLLRADGDHPA